MRSWIIYFVGLVSGLALSFVRTFTIEGAKDIYHRITKTNKPLFSTETAKTADKALTRAENVFQQSCDVEGNLGYPWKINDETVSVEDITNGLDYAMATIKDKYFQDRIRSLKCELTKLHDGTPRLVEARLVLLENGSIDLEEAKKARIRNGQAGLELAKEARTRFFKLNVNG